MPEPPDRPFDSRDFAELSSGQGDRINHSAIDLYARQLAEERERSRKLAEALEEIKRAADAWDEDDYSFGGDTDFERRFECDEDFVRYMALVARAALADTPDTEGAG